MVAGTQTEPSMQSERKTHVSELDAIWQIIMKRDGDRDHDNGSNLTVGEACAIAEACRRVAAFLDPHGARPNQLPRLPGVGTDQPATNLEGG